MSAFQGMEDLLQDFLTEAGELLADVDNKLVDLEKHPNDRKLLNDIFRGFHTIKGGAGFLNVSDLVALCHLTENLFDKLRNGQLTLRQETMDAILEATATVRTMFDSLSGKSLPAPASPELLAALQKALEPGSDPVAQAPAAAPAPAASSPGGTDPDWNALYAAVAGPAPAPVSRPETPAANEEQRHPTHGRRATDHPEAEGVRTGRRENDKVAVAAPESTIRIDTHRLDQVLNLSG